MARSSEPRLGFLLHIKPRPGFTLDQAKALERGIEDYAHSHALELNGHQLVRTVSAEDRSLTAADQVDFIDWLIEQPAINAVSISALTQRLDTKDSTSVWQAGAAEASVCDVGVIGLTILYRAGRITAALYLQILGGFQRPGPLH